MVNILTAPQNHVSVPTQMTATSRTVLPRTGTIAITIAMVLLVVSSGKASAQSSQDTHVKFANVADSTQNLSDFSQFPAINNRGAVAYVATENGTEQKIFRTKHHETTPIASTTAGSQFTSFADNLVINAAGVVGFQASINAPGRVAGIFTSDGLITKTIINSAEQGLSAFGIGTPSINASGTVAFFALRNGFKSSVIFTGDGGALTPILDTVNSNFTAFGATAINDFGEIVFRGILPGRNEGIFTIDPSLNGKKKGEDLSAGSARVTDIVDTLNHDFFGFGDPVINNSGIVADFSTNTAGLEILSGSARGITSRTDPNSSFADVEHPSINNRGAVAFSVLEANGAQGIFVELTGGASPVAVLQSGDPLFGSTVVGVHVGRFAFNDRLQLAFEYELADGRVGIAVVRLHSDEDQEDDDDAK